MNSDSMDSASEQCAQPSETDTPSKVPDTESPAGASNLEPPAEASNIEPPSEASDIEPPAIASNIGPPAKSSNIEHPAEASNVETPARASNISPPVEPSNVEDPHRVSDVELAADEQNGGNGSARGSPLSMLSPSNISSWSKTLKFPQPVPPPQDNSQSESSGMSPFARFTGELGLRLPSMNSVGEKSVEGTSETTPSGVFGSFTKGLVDTSWNAVKAIQVKARHIVSQNKRRYQEGQFDLDMTYITENIIAMGFPAGDISSGFFGYFEGFYRNHMEEVIKFFETHHKGKYKVYNLCSERLYDASLFEGKVASFPFDDHSCPPIHLIASFCKSAYAWLKEDILNVVVVHCKAGMARTGLMICSLLLFLKFFPTADEAIDYYNQKRCVDGKALVLPSQIRYVKYFDRILTYFNGEIQPPRRCMLRGFRLLQCPYWIRPSITISNHSGILFSTRKHPKTKDLMPEDFWIKSPKKGVVVFALPGEPGLTELMEDFKIHFHDRQGDFYCWLNTTMTENRKILDASDLDGFDKRKVPVPGFQVEVVMIDYDGTLPPGTKADSTRKRPEGSTDHVSVSTGGVGTGSNQSKADKNEDNDNVFSDSDEEEDGNSKSKQAHVSSVGESAPQGLVSNAMADNVCGRTEQLSLRTEEPTGSNVSKPTSDGFRNPASGIPEPNLDPVGATDIKSMAADASVFSFGDDDDYESE